MVDVGRARRLAKRIGTIVASVIESDIKDPPLAFVTITDTKVTGDLHDATVFYTVRGVTLDDEPDYEGVAAALERAKGTLRTRVGAGTGVRFTPTLSFALDKVPDTAAHLAELLDRTRAADAELARIREGAKPAGDPDPYRVTGAEHSAGGADDDTDDGDVESDTGDTVDRDRAED